MAVVIGLAQPSGVPHAQALASFEITSECNEGPIAECLQSAGTCAMDAVKAVPPSMCKGSTSGFVIASDGTFTIGPSPTGQKITGTIGAADSQDLQKLVSLAREELKDAPPCLPDVIVPGGLHEIFTGKVGDMVTIINGLDGTIDQGCAQSATSAEDGSSIFPKTEALVEKLHKILLNEYPSKFE